MATAIPASWLRFFEAGNSAKKTVNCGNRSLATTHLRAGVRGIRRTRSLLYAARGRLERPRLIGSRTLDGVDDQDLDGAAFRPQIEP
jgi:hypothetical protein